MPAPASWPPGARRRRCATSGRRARLAQVELRAARGDPASRPLAREALALADQGGYLVVVPRLRALTAVPPTAPA